jgi:RNA polymerase sigma-70 factor (sigma-E family)
MRAAEEQKFREYVAASMDRLRRTAFLYCRDWHTADDLVAATLMKLYQHWERAQLAGSLDAYAQGILTHAWLDEKRRPWRRERVVADVPDAGHSQLPSASPAEFLALLAGLPPRRRACVVLRFYCDLSVEQTAEILGISIGTVKSQTARALDALRGPASSLREE